MNTNILRQISLDIETTGMKKFGLPYKGHRIIEIGAIEIINRKITGKYFHSYLKPNRTIDNEAFNLHGISNKFLNDKPIFAEIAEDFLNFIYDSELIIHNAFFDIGFIDYEFNMLNCGMNNIHTFCKITDSLLLARKIFPGKRNNLDALCDRYLIDNSKRTNHSALIDAKILAEIFLLMTSGQTVMEFLKEEEQEKYESEKNMQIQKMRHSKMMMKIIYANNEEILAHEQLLDIIQKKSGSCLWRTRF
ncbi:DNA polymerase III subunit epsilon [secondary endosymbiont of Trabutina mannipara]|uniref:DNA polymerase III subunit epsilon n=1 Tax=secondary endosymbiont of Trabutina mannipara TaxID=1835721 RepID=A0A1C3L3R6_9ENTR|nr:DNA polymerase III subunit epsilon [secondary endosymbiont of Trabutina mannipara]SBT81922.1 DNA polymerase III subunit epsilon [secondary endosymbiont of Trabutina mannipara]